MAGHSRARPGKWTRRPGGTKEQRNQPLQHGSISRHRLHGTPPRYTPIPDLAAAQAEAAAQIAETERVLASSRARPLVPAGANAAHEAADPAAAHTDARSSIQAPAPKQPAQTAPSAPARPVRHPPGAPVAAAPFCNGYRAAALSSTASCPAAPPPRTRDAGLPPMPPIAPGMTEVQHYRVWGEAMLGVARELSDELPNVSPEERRLNTIRISALTAVAKNLLNGHKPTPLPPLMVPRSPPG